MIQQTSIKSFQSIIPELGARQRLIFRFLSARSEQSFTNLEISSSLGLPINSVTPRIFELRKIGFVVERDRRLCSVTGRLSICWGCVK